jgi:DNA-binding CsgD family transcriptional regulator
MSQAELHRRSQRVSRLLERTEAIAGIGSWEWSPASDELVCSNNLLRIVVLDPETAEWTLAAALRRTHPADRGRVAQFADSARHAVQLGTAANVPAPASVRIVRPDGTFAQLYVSAPVEEHASSGETRLLGIAIDVSADGLARLRRQTPTPLTAREVEVLQLAAEGRSTRELADLLYLSPGTVKTHFQHIYAKLGVSDRAAAVARALRGGWIR